MGERGDPVEEARRLLDLHAKSWNSTADEVWGRPPICAECRQPWPCDVYALAGEVAQLRDERDALRNAAVAPRRYVTDDGTVQTEHDYLWDKVVAAERRAETAEAELAQLRTALADAREKLQPLTNADAPYIAEVWEANAVIAVALGEPTGEPEVAYEFTLVKTEHGWEVQDPEPPGSLQPEDAP